MLLRDLKSKDQLADMLEVGRWTSVVRLLSACPYRKAMVLHKGMWRETWEPRPAFKEVQRRLAKFISTEYVPWFTVHGYVSARSPITNAECHVGRRFVLNFDFKEFFLSINRERVISALILPPFEVRPAIASAIADIACFGNTLPIGAPSSPVISNVVMHEFDGNLQAICFLHDCDCTRYSDDNTISTDEPQFPRMLAQRDAHGVILGPRLQKIVERAGMRINHSKTRLADQTQRQMVTGLVVNERVNVRRSYVRKIRQRLLEWKLMGLDTVSAAHEAITGIEDFRATLFGRIQYVGAVRGFHDPLYLKLEREFARLHAQEVMAARQ